MPMRIDAPCDERWEEMEPRGEGRFCARCQHTVVDLTRLSRRQAEARLARARGDYLCVQLATDARGEAVFAPGPSRARHAAGGLVLVAALTAGGCAREDAPGGAEIGVVEEPCMLPVEGPPMMPVDGATADASDPPTTGPVHVEPTGATAEPTPEQLELTRDKHRPTPPPAVYHTRGRMMIRH